ncbi:MAG: hypothetical protein RR012_08220 [Oscillospiraceae bacterium]
MSDSSTYKNEIAPVRNDIFGKDIKFKEPVDNEIAPVKNTVNLKELSSVK